MLQHFVSTHRTQGRRRNDSNSVPGTELVDLCSLSHDDPDHPICGCARSFVGITSRQTTTTAEIVESDLTPLDYIDHFHHALVAIGWPDDNATYLGVINAAVKMLTEAARWPVGTVVERRGDEICARTTPESP